MPVLRIRAQQQAQAFCLQPEGLEIFTDTQRMDAEGRWASVEIQWNRTRYTVVLVCAPAVPADRVALLSSLRGVMHGVGVNMSSLCMLGDFNTVCKTLSLTVNIRGLSEQAPGARSSKRLLTSVG